MPQVIFAIIYIYWSCISFAVDDVVSKKVLQKFKELEEVKIFIHSWPWEHNPVDTSKFTMCKPTGIIFTIIL